MGKIGIAKTQINTGGGGGGSSSPNFSAIQTGTNVNTLTVGSGGSITTSGIGQVNATQFAQIAIASANPVNLQTFIYDGTNFVWSHQPGVWQALVNTNAATNRLAQTGNLAATTILAVPSSGVNTGGFYTLEVRMIVSQAAAVGTPSSTLPDSRLIFTDGDSSATVTVPMTTSLTTNTTSTVSQATYNFYAKSSTNIQIDVGQITPYASVGTTPMQYSYRARLVGLG